ncbi:MAG TPA: non-canonical purine NTP pyrophosphatase [Acidobacteriaceae bacterium]|nr:non-canonical purine NTP pyrophosphatase [Acidobacteriaceae bacterium]
MPPLTLYVATTNPGKLRDFEAIAREVAGRVQFLSLPGLKNIPAPVEDAPTFEGNARLKAIAYSRHAPGCMVLADDSGLEVDALGGAPGVRSARYAAAVGFNPDPARNLSVDERNNLLLLENLRGLPALQRIARYQCVIAAAQDGQCRNMADGTVEGLILDSPRGNGGFGYDPLFYLPRLNRTMAEISLAEKNRISHRGHALRALLRQFSNEK